MQAAQVESTPVISNLQPIEIKPSLAEKLEQGHRASLARGIDLVVCPGLEIPWIDFLKHAPSHSIALDGLVGGAPNFDAEKVIANFNHHQEVNRLATRSTCGQVKMAVKAGLMESFSAGGIPKINIYANDPDQDSSLSVWLLANHERLSGVRSEPLINKLVEAEDFIDTTAGGYPFDPKSSLMQELAWVFDPYVQARMSGRLRAMDGAEMANVITSVCMRIDRYTLGHSEREELDTRYTIIGGGDSWKMVKEEGFYARSAFFSQGIDAFVSFIAEENGKFHYSIGKRSSFIQFPLEELYHILNEAEGLNMSSGVCWNGGDTIGGSPRRVGSSLPITELEKVINNYLKRRTSRLAV